MLLQITFELRKIQSNGWCPRISRVATHRNIYISWSWKINLNIWPEGRSNGLTWWMIQVGHAAWACQSMHITRKIWWHPITFIFILAGMVFEISMIFCRNSIFGLQLTPAKLILTWSKNDPRTFWRPCLGLSFAFCRAVRVRGSWDRKEGSHKPLSVLGQSELPSMWGLKRSLAPRFALRS